MRCLLLLLALFSGLSCSKDQPPTAPAGKKTGGDLADMFDAFDALQAADGDTAADSTASASPDSSVASDSTSASAPDSSVFSPTAAVSIPDKALREYLEKVLKKNRGATITHADMRKIVNLLEGRNFRGIDRTIPIKSLVGLEAATNLQNVAIRGNQISDVSPLANLPKLRSLDLRGNQISDVSPLANLSELRSLDLRGNQISDVSPLANLSELRYLDLKGNPLSDASAGKIRVLERRGVEVLPSYLAPSDAVLVLIPDVALRRAIELTLEKERGQPISQADMKTLTSFSLSIYEVKSLVGLEAATNLQTLHLSSYNQILDVSLLSNLSNLQTLNLNDNQISDVSSLSNLSNLQTLNLNDNQISDVSSLSNLSNLQTLDLSYNQISDVSSLSNLSNLQTLDLSYNQISDVSLLSSLVNLQTLDLGNNQILDVSLLSNLPNLQTLNLSNNQISDVSLSNLPNLQTLNLSNNQISDVSLSNLPNLQTLDLFRNTISDVSSLSNLPNLRSLDIRSNHPLNDFSINEHVPALQRRGVEVVLSPYERTFPDSPFDIELVFLDDFTEVEKKIMRQAANRWEAAIQADIPDYTSPETQVIGCYYHRINVPAGERIDDLRIYVGKFADRDGASLGFMSMSMDFLRSSGLPFVSCINLNERISSNQSGELWWTTLHEIGHALGIGTVTEESGMFHNPWTADTHFAGPQAIAAFDQAGGTNFQGGKVPMTPDGGHWRFTKEIMGGYGRTEYLSAITLGALSDLGYTVDFSMADPYRLPPVGAAKPVADAVPFCSLEVGGLPPPVYVDD